MQPSPLQLERYSFFKVLVDPISFDCESKHFDFEGVPIKESFNIHEPSESNGHWGLSLMIGIPNNQEGERLCPYTIDVGVIGFFSFADKETDPDKIKDLVVVNGLAILYSSIRELVSQISSRSINGELLLPTVNFMDKIGGKQETKTAGRKSTKAAKDPRKSKTKTS